MTATAPASLLRTLSLGDVDAELASTRRVLERLPDDRLDWRPHVKSWSLGELATHVTRLPGWGIQVAGTDAFDMASLPRATGGALASRTAILENFDANVATFRDALAALTDDALAATWTLRRGQQVLMQMPRLVALRTATLNHLVHHRAQLTVYLRLLDVPVPNLYGPTADER